MYKSLGMVVSAKKSGATFEHEVWRGQFYGKRRKLGFGEGRRVSLMLPTVTEAGRGLSGHDLRRLLGLWVYALSWMWHLWPRNVFRHDVVVPSNLYATDASPSGAGACSTPVSLELRTILYDFSVEKGCSVRLDWNTMPPPEIRDSRAAVAGFVVDLPSVESFSHRFRHPQHINLLELEALISLIRELVDRGLGNRRVLCLVDSRVVLGSVFQQLTCKLPPSDAPSRVYSVGRN